MTESEKDDTIIALYNAICDLHETTGLLKEWAKRRVDKINGEMPRVRGKTDKIQRPER